jgi:hypothetical protein
MAQFALSGFGVGGGGGGGGASSGAEITDKPLFSAVATSGSYGDLSDAPPTSANVLEISSDGDYVRKQDATGEFIVRLGDNFGWVRSSDWAGRASHTYTLFTT